MHKKGIMSMLVAAISVLCTHLDGNLRLLRYRVLLNYTAP